MAAEDPFDRITVEPGKCGGKPCVRGMRITVRRVLELLAVYPDRAALLAEYPFLEPEDLQQALRYAAATVDDERLSVDRVASQESDSAGPGARGASHDFHAHLAVSGPGPPSVVLLRVRGLDAQGQADLIRSACLQCETALSDGAAASADRESTRIRRLPLR